MNESRDLILANFHVLLLAVLFVGLLGFTLHMAHHDMDKELISWGRESAGTVLGSLLYAITGRAISGGGNGGTKQ